MNISKEILERLKNNKEAFGLMSEELQEAAKETGYYNFIFADRYTTPQFSLYSIPLVKKVYPIFAWTPTSQGREKDFDVSRTYRLHPDYQTKPGQENCEIKNIEGTLGIANRCELIDVVQDPNFVRFYCDIDDSDDLFIKLENIATFIQSGHKCYAVFLKDTDGK